MDETKTYSANTVEYPSVPPEQAQRDENRSPSSDSSSETALDDTREAEPMTRKHRRHSRSKRKRRWKPYTELSWAERRVHDDRETKRACAKRERLSAEGHPIAPYNTTQFLMEDHKSDPGNLIKSNAQSRQNSPNSIAASPKQVQNGNSDRIKSESNCNADSRPVINVKVSHEDMGRKKLDSGDRDDIQQYILKDFSHTYAECHADELQSLSKAELVTECLKLEKKVEHLERKVKECQRRHKDANRNQADLRLLDKITQLQAQNMQLLKNQVGKQ